MTRNKNITIKDIANHANVSISTVSRVLRNSSVVSSEKSAAVLKAVAELDYRPNIFAQSLASGQSMTIGVVTQNFGTPFYDAILLGIITGLEQSDYSAIFADGRWHLPTEKEALQMLIDRRVDGLIIIGGQLPYEFLNPISQQTPLINVARQLPAMADHCIYADNFKSSYELTTYLLEMGHRNIAHITAATHYENSVNDISQRLAGYKQALLDADVPYDENLVVEGNLMQQSGVLAVEMLLAQRRAFSAIFAANDQMAFGARLALHRRGIRVPDEVSLVGFDDETTAAYMIPPLTTVRQPAVEMGHAAANAILDLLNQKPVTTQICPTKLIVRESVLRYR